MFLSSYLPWFSALSPSWVIFLTAMLPIAELRAAIPLGIGLYHLPVWWVYLLAVAGNLVPAVAIIWWLEPIAQWFGRHVKWIHRLLNWWFARTQKHFSGSYQNWGALALIIFVAMPLPMMGAWTGAAAAWLFHIPRARAIGYVTIGVLLMGLLVTGLTLGTIKLTALW